MCTVTFVPTKEGFVFSSNRDEDPQRAAHNVVEDTRGDLRSIFRKIKVLAELGLLILMQINLPVCSTALSNPIKEKNFTP